MMGPSFIEAGRIREIKDEMKVLCQLIFMQRSMIEELKGRVSLLEQDNKAGMYSPSVPEFFKEASKEIDRLRETLQAIHDHQKRMPNIDWNIWELTRAALGEKE